MPARAFPISPTGMVSALVIWIAHFLVVYVFAALACARRFAHLEVFGVGIVPLVVTIATLVALGAVLILLIASLRRDRADRYSGPDTDDAARFMRSTAILTATLAAIAIAWNGLPALMIPACR